MVAVGIAPTACVGTLHIRRNRVLFDSPTSIQGVSPARQQQRGLRTEVSPETVKQLSRGSVIGERDFVIDWAPAGPWLITMDRIMLRSCDRLVLQDFGMAGRDVRLDLLCKSPVILLVLRAVADLI